MNTNNKNKYLIKNTIIFAIGSIGTKFISFFLVPLYTNVLTTSEYGTVDLIFTLTTMIIPFLTLNIAEAIMRFALDKDANYNKIMSIGLLLCVATIVIGLLIIPFSQWSSIKDLGLYFYLYTVTYAINQILLCYLRGTEKLLPYSIGNILHALAIAVLNIVFLLVFRWGISGYFWAYILANTITAIYAFFAGKVHTVIKNFEIDRPLFKEMVRYSLFLIPNSIMWWIMNSSDRIMVTALISSAANGIYAISYKIPTLLNTVTSVFNSAWSYSAIKEKDGSDELEYNNYMYDNLVKLVLIVAVALLVVIKPFLSWYVEESYYEAWKYVPPLMIGFVFMTLGTFVSTIFIVNKDSKRIFYSGAIGAVINIILNFLLIPSIGVAGAAIATMAGYFTVFIYRCYGTRRYLKLNVLRKSHIGGYVVLLLTAATCYVDGYIGQIVLIVELCILLFLYRKFVVEAIELFVNQVKKKIHRM